MCSIIIMSQKILESLCRNHFFHRRTDKYIPTTLLLGILSDCCFGCQQSDPLDTLKSVSDNLNKTMSILLLEVS